MKKNDVEFHVRKSQVHYADILHFIPEDLLLRGGYYLLKDTTLGFKDDSFFIDSYAESDTIPFYTLNFYNSKGRFAFSNAVIRFKDFSTRYYSTDWRFKSASIHIPKQTYIGNGSFQGLNLSMMRVNDLTGRINGDFTINGQYFTPDKRRFGFTTRFKGGRFKEYNPSLVEASAVYSPSQLQINHARLSLGNGEAVCKGRVYRNGTLDLTVNSKGFPLLKPLPFTGFASFTGQLQGSLQKPDSAG